MPFSHDEVVHGKKTIIDKLYGNYEDKFAQARLLYLYMMTHPGKKLNFMGYELAMFREWDEKREPDWDILKMPMHDAFHQYISVLNHLYMRKNALWEIDHSYNGFKWVDCKSENKCIFGYTRTGKSGSILTILNFSDQQSAIASDMEGTVNMLLNTDWEPFGGNTKHSAIRRIPDKISPFSGMLFSCISAPAL